MDERKVRVWVCNEQKLLSGLTRHTTCADVVRVLLEERGARPARDNAYCIVEKWRGLERQLPAKTHLLHLWRAWGRERDNVRFIMVKNEASLSLDCPRSAEARLTPAHTGERQTPSHTRDRGGGTVKKTLRKLEQMSRTLDSGTMETLIHLVVSQDHTIRQQVHRLHQLDRHIERHESRVHMERVRRHGRNYVQDTYLQDGDTLAQWDQYAGCCEDLVHLQDQLDQQQILLDAVTADIRLELEHPWDGDEIVRETERVQSLLDSSVHVSLQLDTELDTVHKHLQMSQNAWDTQDVTLRHLLQREDMLALEGTETVLLSVHNETEVYDRDTTEDRCEDGDNGYEDRCEDGDNGYEDRCEDGDNGYEDRCEDGDNGYEDRCEDGDNGFEDRCEDGDNGYEDNRYEDKFEYGDDRYEDKFEYGDDRYEDRCEAGGDRCEYGDDRYEDGDDRCDDGDDRYEDRCDDGDDRYGSQCEERSRDRDRCDNGDRCEDRDSAWVEEARGLGKTCNNDEDSDTGLSSMHSQDSDTPAVCESLV